MCAQRPTIWGGRRSAPARFSHPGMHNFTDLRSLHQTFPSRHGLPTCYLDDNDILIAPAHTIETLQHVHFTYCNCWSKQSSVTASRTTKRAFAHTTQTSGFIREQRDPEGHAKIRGGQHVQKPPGMCIPLMKPDHISPMRDLLYESSVVGVLSQDRMQDAMLTCACTVRIPQTSRQHIPSHLPRCRFRPTSTQCLAYPIRARKGHCRSRSR